MDASVDDIKHPDMLVFDLERQDPVTRAVLLTGSQIGQIIETFSPQERVPATSKLLDTLQHETE